MDQIGDYKIENRLGAGSFAQVFKAYNKKTGQVFAIKMVDLLRVTDNSKFKENLNFEIRILKMSGVHPNIVTLYDVIEAPPPNKDTFLYMVMECCDSDFARYLKNHKKFTEDKALHFMKQLAEGLRFLRQCNIVHRDLKPQNLLLKDIDSEYPILKIADFGFAKITQVQSLSDTYCGSPLYMAPEILKRQNYTVKADLWSVGVIFYEMLVGEPPFNSSTVENLILQLKSKSIKIPSHIQVSRECQDLLFSLLQTNETNRISWEDFFSHPWFKLNFSKPINPNNNNYNNQNNYNNNNNSQNNVLLSSSLNSSFLNILPSHNSNQNQTQNQTQNQNQNPLKISTSLPSNVLQYQNMTIPQQINPYSTSPPLDPNYLPFQFNNKYSSSPNNNTTINNNNNTNNLNNPNNRSITDQRLIYPFKDNNSNLTSKQPQVNTNNFNLGSLPLDFEKDCVILDDEIYSMDKVLNIAKTIAELGDLRLYEPTECLLLYVKALNLMKVKIQQQQQTSQVLSETFKSTFKDYIRKAIQIFSSPEYQQKIDYIKSLLNQQQIQQNSSNLTTSNPNTNSNGTSSNNSNSQITTSNLILASQIQNQQTALPLFSPNKFIYESALDFGKKGAVEEVLKNYSKSIQFYNDGLLLFEYLLSISIDKDDKDILKKFVSSFCDRISYVNKLTSGASSGINLIKNNNNITTQF